MSRLYSCYITPFNLALKPFRIGVCQVTRFAHCLPGLVYPAGLGPMGGSLLKGHKGQLVLVETQMLLLDFNGRGMMRCY